MSPHAFIPPSLAAPLPQGRSWRLFGALVAVGAAMLTALLYVRRWTLLPLAAAVRALCGFGRATPRFRNGADQQSELGIHIPGTPPISLLPQGERNIRIHAVGRYFQQKHDGRRLWNCSPISL